jgi:hypothetical protein
MVNGNPLPNGQLANNVDWFIDGHTAGGAWGAGMLTISGSDATCGPGMHTLNAEYLGFSTLPNTSISVNVATLPNNGPALA